MEDINRLFGEGENDRGERGEDRAENPQRNNANDVEQDRGHRRGPRNPRQRRENGRGRQNGLARGRRGSNRGGPWLGVRGERGSARNNWQRQQGARWHHKPRHNYGSNACKIILLSLYFLGTFFLFCSI